MIGVGCTSFQSPDAPDTNNLLAAVPPGRRSLVNYGSDWCVMCVAETDIRPFHQPPDPDRLSRSNGRRAISHETGNPGYEDRQSD